MRLTLGDLSQDVFPLASLAADLPQAFAWSLTLDGRLVSPLLPQAFGGVLILVRSDPGVTIATPEPATSWLLMLGLVAVGLLRWRVIRRGKSYREKRAPG